MEEEDEDNFVGFRTTLRNTTMKQRYLSLSTDDMNIIRSMIGEISHVAQSARFPAPMLGYATYHPPRVMRCACVALLMFKNNK